MNCPECGRFMSLEIAFEAGKEDKVWACAFWWVCCNVWGHYYEVDPIPAPEYQWLWNCEGIPREALDDWPELRAEYIQMWAQLPASVQRRYRREYERAILMATAMGEL